MTAACSILDLRKKSLIIQAIKDKKINESTWPEDRYFTVTSFCHYSDKNGVKKPTFQGDFITKDQYQNKFLALYVTRHGKLIYAEDQIKKLKKKRPSEISLGLFNVFFIYNLGQPI